MKSLLDDAQYHEIYQTLASTERGQAFLNRFAEKHNSLESKKLQSSCNKLSSFAYAVAQDFSSEDSSDTVEDLDEFEQPDELNTLAPEPADNNLPDIGELSASNDSTDMSDLMVDTDKIEVDFEPETNSSDQQFESKDEEAMNDDLSNELTSELQKLKNRMADLEGKISAL